MAPRTALGPWPYERVTAVNRAVWDSALWPPLSRVFGAIYYFDLATTVTLVFACLTPLAIWAHARELLGSSRIALIAAAVVACLPTHIRFSHSEVAFIPSIAISSTTFFVLHVAMKDDAKRMRRVAMVALPFLSAATFMARPLNQLFLPLLLITGYWFAREHAPRARRLVACALMTVAAVVTATAHLLGNYRDQIGEGMTGETLVRGARALFSVHHNTLINVGITPPLLLLAAVLGVAAHVRSEQRGRVLFLILWLLAFFVAHAYVLPEAVAMQARYHLHLVVPFAFLAALGIDAVASKHRAAAALLMALVVASPALHAGFIGDVDFSDLNEHAFVADLVDRVGQHRLGLSFGSPRTGRRPHLGRPVRHPFRRRRRRASRRP